MDGKSLAPEQEKLNALKQILPEVFAEGKVDWEKLKATLGEDVNFTSWRCDFSISNPLVFIAL